MTSRLWNQQSGRIWSLWRFTSWNQTRCSRLSNSCYCIITSEVATGIIVLLDTIMMDGSKVSGSMDLGILAVVVQNRNW